MKKSEWEHKMMHIASKWLPIPRVYRLGGFWNVVLILSILGWIKIIGDM
ncbi:hypothetical protein [Thalassobacillus hwangdonensis]|uniref:Uncharacterized protein n=1 Tax=Thalassobacillus hwangdonensis TaxID=546108 RepID=A0ABW3L186_9BACI